MIGFVPLRWRFFTGFNVLRSEEEKRRDYHRYLMLSFIRGIKEASRAVIAMADAIGKAGDSIMDFALQVNEMQEIPEESILVSNYSVIEEKPGAYLHSFYSDTVLEPDFIPHDEPGLFLIPIQNQPSKEGGE